MVVCTPDVNDPVKPPLQFVQVVGNIRCKVGWDTSVPYNNAIFIISKERAVKPEVSFSGVGMAFFLQFTECPFHCVVFVKGLFTEPCVEMGAKIPEVFLYPP